MTCHEASHDHARLDAVGIRGLDRAAVARHGRQTNTVASIRFAFFFMQIVGFLWLIGIVVSRA